MNDAPSQPENHSEPSLKDLLDLQERKEPETKRLLEEAKRRLPQLKQLLADVSDPFWREDPVYRFYHHSFKVHRVQAMTQKIVEEMQTLAPHLKLNEDFLQMVREGTGKEFDMSHNADWLRHTRPIIEAFFHARHMLEMLCKYAEELDEPPQPMPTGWATVLYLYNLR
jgi:hypothetical protein